MHETEDTKFRVEVPSVGAVGDIVGGGAHKSLQEYWRCLFLNLLLGAFIILYTFKNIS